MCLEKTVSSAGAVGKAEQYILINEVRANHDTTAKSKLKMA